LPAVGNCAKGVDHHEVARHKTSHPDRRGLLGPKSVDLPESGAFSYRVLQQ
jgi:hypothetical protein